MLDEAIHACVVGSDELDWLHLSSFQFFFICWEKQVWFSLMCRTHHMSLFENPPLLSSPLLMITFLAPGYRQEIFRFLTVVCLRKTLFLFVWKCCSIIFHTSKQGWWILPLENALPVGAIMCAVTSPVIVFTRTLWKSLLHPCFCPRPLFLFLRCWNKSSAALWVKANGSYFIHSFSHSNQQCTVITLWGNWLLITKPCLT